MPEQEKYFNDLVKKYSEPLYWHVRAMVGSHEDTDDLLQEIFIKVWNAMPRFRGDSDVFTWLWRIATNETLSHLRKARVRAALSFVRIDTEAERISFSMRYYEDLSYEQISEITGTSVGALKASYHIAYEKIKQHLTE